MAAKKPTKAKAATPKGTKTAKTKAKGKPADEAQGTCPRGGSHEWTTDGEEPHCRKCQEPAPQGNGKSNGKGKAKEKPTAAKAGGKKKLSALDAAAQVLSEFQLPMNCQELIEAMATKGLWTSPGGKTPAQTLYSAITREIATKGDASRFAKADRGKFAAKA